MTRPSLPLRWRPSRGRRRAGARDEDGFILLESLVAIGLISVILAALGTFTLQTVTQTNALRVRQGATQVATTAMTNVDSIPATDLLTKRDVTSAHNQYASAPASVTSAYLNGLAEKDNGSTTVTGAGATISTSPQTTTLNNVVYTVNTYVGGCVMVDKTSACVKSGTGVNYLRVVVWVTWSGRGCQTSAGCTFATSTLINADDDPVFNTNKATPPATPIVVQPDDQKSTVTGSASLTLQVKAGTGVNPFTWAVTSGTLPLGLTLDANGTIAGTPSATQAASPVTVTVTDAFGRTGSTTFNWTVFAAPTVTTPGAQSTRANTATSLNIASTCPNATCTFTMSGAPAGLTINASTGVISGTPTTVGTNSVVVTVTDAANVSARTAAFTWTITAAGPTVTSPGNQNVTVGTTVSIPIPYTCPNPTCTITLSNGIPGLTLTNPAASANNATPETASKFTTPGTVDTTGSTNLSQGKTATQSSLAFGGLPARAVDGNIDGVYNNNSISHTDNTATQPWWQVDLGSASLIRAVKIWNRTDCCSDRLSYFYVFTSPTDMSTKTSAQLLADPTVTVQRIAGLAGSPSITIPAQSAGRYVRVQLSSLGANQDHYLSLAEVQVLGTVDTGNSITVSSTSGTVYATGTVAASAVPSGTSKAYTPGLSIVDVNSASDAKSAGTWTAYTPPTVASLGTRTMATQTSPSIPVDYTCPNTPCTVTVAGQPPGLGLATAAGTTANANPSLTLQSTSGTVYVTGLIDASAVPSGKSKVYAPSVNLTDNGTAVVTGSGTWTVTKGPTLTNPGTQAVEPNQPASLQMAYVCPNSPCTTWSASATVVGGDGTIYPVTVSNTGVVSYTNAPSGGTFNVQVTVTDKYSQSDTVSFTLKVQTFSLNITDQTIPRPASGTATKTLDVSSLVQPSADGYIYSVSNAPSWLTIDSATGLLTATVNKTSTSATGITVTVTSKLGSSSTVTSNTFNWTVTG